MTLNRAHRAVVAGCLAAIHAHITQYPGIAVPVSITIDHDRHDATAWVHLCSGYRLAPVAAGLAGWVDTLTEVTGRAWRIPSGASVHLYLTGQAAGVSVTVWDVVHIDADTFPGLHCDQQQPLTVEQLRAWATGGAA